MKMNNVNVFFSRKIFQKYKMVTIFGNRIVAVAVLFSNACNVPYLPRN